MSVTPAAQLAAVRLRHPSWTIARTEGGGFTADRYRRSQTRGVLIPDRHIWAPSLAALELALRGKPRRG